MQIHALRDEATTAHAEDRDGTGKPGLTETEATLAKKQFIHVYPRYIDQCTQLGQRSGRSDKT